MKQYKIDEEIYQDIWVAVEENRKRKITHHVLDRWLSIFHGLTAISDESDDDNFWYYLMYSYVTKKLKFSKY